MNECDYLRHGVLGVSRSPRKGAVFLLVIAMLDVMRGCIVVAIANPCKKIAVPDGLEDLEQQNGPTV